MARKDKNAAAANQFDMTAAVAVDQANVNTDALLGDLLDQLGDDTVLESLEVAGDDVLDGVLDEIIEPAGEVAADIAAMPELAAGDATDALLDEITEDAEALAAKRAVYAEQGSEGATDANPPESDPNEVAAGATEPKKKGGSRKKKAADDGEPAEPKAPKEPRATKVTHKPGDLLLAKLGDKAADYLALRFSDADQGDEVLKQRQADFIARMNDTEAIADKVKEKMQMFLVWLTKGGELNEVLKRSLTLLHAEGKLTSGDKGNLQLNLLAKPYSVGTARSQANQMFMALPELGLTIKTKGEMVPNPDSALLPMAYAMLGLA